MLDVPVLSTKDEQVGQMSIDDTHLGARVRPQLLKQAVVMYLANRRQGSASTKSRGMVQGSTRKLYRQKGTGNARVGSSRAPQRRGGGRAFAKRPKDFSKRMPKRMRRLACKNAILTKILSNDVLIIEELSLKDAKTQELRSVLGAIGGQHGCLLALEAPDLTLYRSARNIPKTDIRPVIELNAYEVLRRKKLIFTKAAFASLTERAAREYEE